MRKILLAIFITIFLGIAVSFVPMSKADDNSCSNTNCTGGPDYCIGFYNQCLATLQKALSDSENATHPLQSQLQALQTQIENIKNQVAQIESSLAQKQKIIDDSFKNIAQKQILLNATIRDFYIKSTYNSPLLILFSASSANELTQVLGYQKAVEDQDKLIITNLAITIANLQIQKQQLQSEEASLTTLKSNLDTQSAKLNDIIQGALAYQSQLNTQIAQISSAQQSLLAQKYSSLGIPLTAYTSSNGCSSDINPYKDPGFSGTKFGFFTYGVYHRVGMNQYGAKGRADKGQSYQQILSFYYPNTQIANVGNTSITVDGTNDYGETFSNQSFNIEDYLTHIYEMPSSWNPEALKAQAIAARTYAYQAVQSGKTTVAPDQSFQEVKTEQNAQSWIDAVNATSGQVLESGGSPITAWFSSTGGGYTHNSGDVFGNSTSYTTTTADTNGSVNNFSDLQNNAYDGPNYANSPWFYCDWGGRSQYNNTAWLQSSEVADIVNVIMLAQKDPSTAPHLSQTDGSIPDTWSADQVKQQLQNDGITPFNNVSGISVSPDFNAGKITNVTVNGDVGSQNFSGDTFATYFDVRAPGNIFIPCLRYNSDRSCASASLFNVETR